MIVMETAHPTRLPARADFTGDKVLLCEMPRLCPLPEGNTAGRRPPRFGDRIMEFHVRADIRSQLGTQASLFRTSGNLILPDFRSARVLADRMRSCGIIRQQDVSRTSAGNLNAMALIDEILHIVFSLYRENIDSHAIRRFESAVVDEIGRDSYETMLREFGKEFPPRDVYRGVTDYDNWLASSSRLSADESGVPNRELALEEIILLRLANENPAFASFRVLFDDGNRKDKDEPDSLSSNTLYLKAFSAIEEASRDMPPFGPEGEKQDIISLLRMPAKMAPGSLADQLRWIKDNWGATFASIGLDILKGLDLIKEEETPRFGPGPGPVQPYDYRSLRHEYEKFSPDSDWMPSLVLIAKNALVWLHQLSGQYDRPIARLDEIPDEELDRLADRGINGLWLIGIWERSQASEKIKKMCGNPEAAASAYAIYDYDIAGELGGWEALDHLRERCLWRGIRLAADMVPNHTGIDSAWVRDRPELFMGLDYCPYPSYSFSGPDLSGDPNVGIWLEDHYYTRADAAVVFKRLDRRSGKVRYIYHGNDGTGMAWNDTAQIDFLNPEARAAVKEKILHVAQHFSIIRFDAAMVLAKQHVRRLWYPAPGSGGAIPSRSEHAMSDEAFDRAMPNEFWREVVDECAAKASDTLLLAEAFWMMEGYFVRTLGMHRVYNSAFMNMLKDEKNSMYRMTVKNTQEFDRQILKRYVNFMSNPDEETAINQFGSGDKYFGVCTMMATMPGLPMFGHGQIEGFTEKYGMEYRRSYRDEKPDQALVERHEREIFPLLRMRRLFAEVDRFCLYDFYTPGDHVDENVFAYSNGRGDERALVFYNNHWERTAGKISLSCQYAAKDGTAGKRMRRESLIQALDLDPREGNYLVVREARTGLSYVFSCATLQSEGWAVTLEGYEAKVFVDFTRVRDFDGSYARLCEELDGRGIADLDSAIEEASKPELYHALSETLGHLATFAALLQGRNAAQADREIAAAGEASERFFSRLAQTIDAEGGPQPAIDAAAAGGATLERGLSFVAAIVRHTENEARGSGPRGALTPGAEELLGKIVKSDRALKALLYYCFIHAVAGMQRSGNQTEELRYILDKFLLRKKMLESLRLCRARDVKPPAAPALESPEKEEPVLSLDRIDDNALCSIIFAFATRPMGTVVPPDANPSSSSPSRCRDKHARAETEAVENNAAAIRERSVDLLRWTATDAEAQAALGINTWEGVEYFNKEKMEAMLELVPSFAMIEKHLEHASAGGNAGTRPSEQKLIAPAAHKAREVEGSRLQELVDEEDLAVFAMCDTIRELEEPGEFRMDRLISLVAEKSDEGM